MAEENPWLSSSNWGHFLTLPLYPPAILHTLKLEGKALQSPWPLLASSKPSQHRQVGPFRAWSNEGGNWPDAQPIYPAIVIPREMKWKHIHGEGKAEKSIGRDFEFMENWRQPPDYASNPRVKRKARMSLAEPLLVFTFLSQMHWLHHYSTIFMVRAPKVAFATSDFLFLLTLQFSLLQMPLLLFLPAPSYYVHCSLFLIIKVIQIHGGTFWTIEGQKSNPQSHHQGSALLYWPCFNPILALVSLKTGL